MRSFVVLISLLTTLSSASPFYHTQNYRSLPWVITFIDYVPSVPLVNFVLNRPENPAKSQYTLCTGRFNNTPAWQECSYYQFANGTRSDDLDLFDQVLLRWAVPAYSTGPGTPTLSIEVVDGVQAEIFRFDQTNLECGPARGGEGEQCFLLGTQ